VGLLLDLKSPEVVMRDEGDDLRGVGTRSGRERSGLRRTLGLATRHTQIGEGENAKVGVLGSSFDRG
jgi:hypothetical protein